MPRLSNVTHTISDEVDYDGEGRIKATRHLMDGNIISSTAFAYDSSGNTITSTDPFGKVTVSRYDAQGNLVEMRTPSTDQNGNPVTLIVRKAYDADGRLIAQTAPYVEGVTPTSDILVTHTIYDGAGREVESRQVQGVTIDLTYISGGTGSDHEGGIFQSQFNYDPNTNTYGGMPAASVVVSSNSTVYNDQGLVDHTVSETGLTTYFQYDGDGNQTESYYDITTGGTTQHVVTQYKYDADGRQTEVIDPAGRVTAYAYNDGDQVTKTVSYGVEPANFVPDLNNIPSTAIVTQSVYNALGQQIATIDGLGRETDYEYDSAGRMIAVTLPSISSTDTRRPRYEYHYDAQGHKTLVVTNVYVDPANPNQVFYITKSNSGGPTITSRSITAPWLTTSGDVTTFTFDSQGRQTARQLPVGLQSGGYTEQTVYDTSNTVSNGEVWYTIDFSGRLTAYDYDNSATGGGRVKDVRYYTSLASYNSEVGPGHPNAVRTISYTYDAFGRQVVVADTTFTTPTTYTYDVFGHVTEIDSAQGSMHYAYDNLGRQIAAWTGTGATLTAAASSATTLTEYGYDQLGRLISTTQVRRFGANVDVKPSVTGIQPEVDSTVYAVDGEVNYEITTTAGDDLVKAFSYDTFGRTSEIQYFDDANSNHVHDSGETVLQEFDYTYNKDNTRATEMDYENGIQTANIAWTYDGEQEVASEDFTGLDDGGNSIHYTDTYAYDLSGNRISLSHDHISGSTTSDGPSFTTTSLYDANDRLFSETKIVTSDASQDTYTAYGYTGTDQTSQTVHQGTSSSGSVLTSTSYSYDVTGAMTGVSITTTGVGTQSVTYKYDATGNRVERTQSGVTTIYLIDSSNPTGYSQVIEEGTDTNGNEKLDASEVLKTYTLGVDVLTQATESQVLHLLTDAHGSTRAVVNLGTALALLQRYVYTAYGVDLAGSTTPLTAVRYSGQMIDALTGLSFNRARWYDPSTGGFTTLDPEQGSTGSPLSFNHYLYGSGNPITNSDPTGRDSLVELMVSTLGGESLDTLQNAYKSEKAASNQAKFLVSLAMVEMYVLTFQVDGLGLAERAFQSIYYAYEIVMFQKRVNSSVKEELKLDTNIPTLLQYIAGLPAATSELDSEDSATASALGPLTWLTNKGKVHRTVFIPLTGTRRYDNYLSWAALIGFNLSSIIDAMESGATSWVAGAFQQAQNVISFKGFRLFSTRFGTFGKLSWHHNEILGIMELVDEEKNSGLGSQGHVGSPVFWSILTGEDYK